MEKRNAFRKRANAVLRSGSRDCHLRASQVGEHTFVTQICGVSSDELKFAELSPTLDEQLRAGVAVKEVNVDGLLDSYDVNDTPLVAMEEKIVSKGRKKSNPKKEVENE